MHILLIEPNSVLAKTYMNTFLHAGFTVAYVSGAQMAIDAADTESPDIVVLELQLAEHSGIEFLHEFRSYAEWQNVPVIVNTMIVPTRLQVVSTALRGDLGVRTILYKPRTSLKQLLHAVREQATAA